MLKKFFLDKINGTNMTSFLFCKLHLITALLLICYSYMSWSTEFVFRKLGFSIIFFFNKMHGLLTLKRHNSIQTWNNWKATHVFALRPMIFKLLQEVWKFNDICVSWAPKKWPGDKFFKFRKSKFWEHQFFSILTFK